MKNKITIKIFSLFLFIALVSASSTSLAKVVSQEPTVPHHDLRCDDVFTCPQQIKRRVDFWIAVFRTWGKDNKIIHDANKPERVYMVLEDKNPCSRKKPKGEVKWALKKVKNRLQSYANLIASGASQQQIESHRYYKLFPNANLKEVRKSIKAIRCQSGNRELFSQALIEYQNYQPYVSKALKQQNLPADIQYLPFVESSYNPKAYSFAGAAGMWQIMPATARSLGLQIGSSVDERFEPEFATLAAAKYFRNSIDKLTETAKEGGHSTRPADMNPFVITSYNYGVRGMERAIEKVGTDYIDLLNKYKSNSFRTAVRNFYASFLAARYVAQNSDRYFPEISLKSTTKKVDRIATPKPLLMKNVLWTLKLKQKTLKKLNPALTYRVWNNTRAIPTGFIIKVPHRSEGWKSEVAKLKKLRSYNKGGYNGKRHKVRSGQTACGIANRYKVRCKDLISLNRLGRKAVIKIGQRLKIPGGVQKYRKTNIVKSSQELLKNLALNPQPAIIKRQAEVKAITASSTTLTPSTPNKVVNLNTKVFQLENRYWIKVLPSESLGLYSDWLKLGSTKPIRDLNNLQLGAQVNVFQRVVLPISSKQEADSFTLSRNEHHLNIQLQYFQAFEVVSVSRYRPKRKETIWSIAKSNNIPMWLLMQYNPFLQKNKSIRLPEVRRK